MEALLGQVEILDGCGWETAPYAMSAGLNQVAVGTGWGLWTNIWVVYWSRSFLGCFFLAHYHRLIMSVKTVKYNGTLMPIREFQLEWLCENPSICMIAKRGSGKSWVTRSILKHFRNIPGGVIIAPTDKMNCFYGKFYPESYIHYQYSSELIENILHRQDKIIQKAKKYARKHKKCDPRAILIMDDCLASKGSWATDQPIMEVFYNGRHYMLMYILTMQFPLGIKPELRANFDYIFLFSEDFYSNQKRIYEHYAGMFPTFDSFRTVFLQLTDDFGSMVIVNRGSRKDFLDKIFWFKAGKDNIKQIGCNQFNKFHDRNYDPDWRTNTHTIDINKIVGKKK